MSYILVGSYASLFVRRIRMAMEHIPFEFRVLNLWEEAGAAEIKKLNPINQIPCLIDSGEVIWDSRIILQHLAKKHQWPGLSLEAENRLTAIEGIMDAGVSLFLMKKSGIDLSTMYPQRLSDRIVAVVNWLKPWMKSAEAREWNLSSLTLVAALEWLQYREIHPSALTNEAQDFLSLHAHRPIVQNTHPSKAS